MEWTFKSHTNAMIELRILPMLHQMTLLLSWEGGRERRFPNMTTLTAFPQRGVWIDPVTREEVNPWAERKTDKVRALMAKPSIPFNMSTIFWNARGIARNSFKPNFCHIVNEHHPDIVILAETHASRRSTIPIVHSLPFDSWPLVDPIGFAGGIIILWNSARVNLTILCENSQSITALVEVSSNPSPPFILTAVYASPRFNTRSLLWSNLRDMADTIVLPLIVFGDFNEVTCQAEKLGGNPISKNRTDIFNKTLDDYHLMDLGFSGPRFTWSNKRKHAPIHERLDRGCANDT